jgi:hypothetical protein
LNNSEPLFCATAFNSPNSIPKRMSVCHFRMYALHAHRSCEEIYLLLHL